MGTVLIYDGEAFVFRGMEPHEALLAFMEEWQTDVVRGVQLFPLVGYQTNEESHGTSPIHKNWGGVG